MTAKERAEALQKFYVAWRADPYGDRQSMLDEFERAFAEAIEEERKSRECCKAEREVCAKVADDEAKQWSKDSLGELSALAIADKIRAQSDS